MIPTERLLKALQKNFGLQDFRPGQLEIINSVMNGFDTLAVMPTGGGKSICYQLPATLLDGVGIVITPLISLMKDQVAQANKRGRIATQLDSSLELDEIQDRLRLVRSGGVKLLYVAPERLESGKFVEMLSRIRISMLVVDEAHCISQWGHDFRPHYSKIANFGDAVGKPVVLALTATATPDVQDDIVVQLRMRSPRVYIRGFARQNLSFRVLVEKGKNQSILEHVSGENGTGIIYAATRKSVDEVYDFLKSRGIDALRYHAGLTEAERTKSQSEFLHSNHVMVATNAFGMGINKPDVRYVIHYEIPGTLEAYYQEAGRGGRDGKLAECILLFHKRDLGIQEYFINTLFPTRDDFIKVYNGLFNSLSVEIGSRSDDYLTVSTDRISELSGIGSRSIDSVLRLLSQHQLIQLMPSVSANSFVRAKIDIASYRRAIERTASHDSREVMEALLRLHGNAIFSEARPVRLDELGKQADIGPSNVGRTLSILHRSGVIDYRPATEGVTFKMLARRESPERLPIDFGQISLLKERAHQRLSRMAGYALTTACRSNYILDYFGAEITDDGCGNCDNCTVIFPYSQADGDQKRSSKNIHTTILSLVKSTEGRYGRSTYCKILLEDGDKVNGEPGYSEEFTGRLADVPAQAVYSAMDFLLARKFLSRKGLVYPTVSITSLGEEYLKSGIAPSAQKPFAFKKALYKALRDERRVLSTETGIPVFTVCPDDTLVRIANDHPVDEQEMSAYLAREGAHADKIFSRLLQVCLDFSMAAPLQLSPAERRAYELFREKLTASEIAAALSTSAQGVIETLEALNRRGLGLDLRSLINNRTFSILKAELEKSKDVVAVHGTVGDCELAEVALVARLTGVAT